MGETYQRHIIRLTVLILLFTVFGCDINNLQSARNEIVPTPVYLSATSTPIPTEQMTPALLNTPQPTPTPVPPGSSRAKPLPFGEIIHTSEREIEVIELIRGEDAWTMLNAANQFNDPPPDEMEYLLMKLRVKNISTVEEEQSLRRGDFKLTTDRLTEYRPDSAVVPAPDIKAGLFPGGEKEGWVPFLIHRNEAKLMLIFQQVPGYQEDNTRYLALEPNIAIGIDPQLAAIQPSEEGLTRADAAKIEQLITTEDWQLTVLKVIRGERAWNLITETNQYNDPPAEGMEYILVKLRAKYIGQKDTAVSVGGGFFESTGSKNVVYDSPAIVDPEPDLDASLFPGGETEGWITLLIAVDEERPTMIFEPYFEPQETGKRYFQLYE